MKDTRGKNESPSVATEHRMRHQDRRHDPSSGTIDIHPIDIDIRPTTKGHAKTDESLSVATPTKAEFYASAAKRMRRGHRLVISGFIVAVMGIVAYCVACLNAGVNPELGSALIENPGWLVGPTLGMIGLGTLIWLVGSFVYLNGAMDSDPNGPDLDF